MTNNLIVQKTEDCVPNLLNFISNSSEKMCMVLMSHSYEFLKSKLVQQGIKDAKIFFIDCITRSLFLGVQDTPDCTFMHIQMDMKDFLYEISEKLKKQIGAKIFIFDSLSDLKQYWSPNPDSFLDFAKSLFPILSELGADSYFIIYEQDKERCTEQHLAAFDAIYFSFSKEKESKR